MLKPDHSLAWNNMVILLDNTGKDKSENTHLQIELYFHPNKHKNKCILAFSFGAAAVKKKQSEFLS